MHEQKNSLPPCTDQLKGYRVSGGHKEMDLPPQIDDYVKETIDHTLGLSVSMQMQFRNSFARSARSYTPD